MMDSNYYGSTRKRYKLYGLSYFLLPEIQLIVLSENSVLIDYPPIGENWISRFLRHYLFMVIQLSHFIETAIIMDISNEYRVLHCPTLFESVLQISTHVCEYQSKGTYLSCPMLHQNFTGGIGITKRSNGGISIFVPSLFVMSIRTYFNGIIIVSRMRPF